MNLNVSHYLERVAQEPEDICSELVRFAHKSILAGVSSIQIVYYPNKDMLDYIINILKFNIINKDLVSQEINIFKNDDLFTTAKNKKVIYIVHGIHGKAELVRRLNWKREVLTDNAINLIVFVNYSELVDLGERAPDFWAFKNKFYVVQTRRMESDKSFNISKFEHIVDLPKEALSPERADSIEEMLFSPLFVLSLDNAHFVNQLLEYSLGVGKLELGKRIIEKFGENWNNYEDTGEYIEYIILCSMFFYEWDDSNKSINILKKELKKQKKNNSAVLSLSLSISKYYIKTNDLSTARVYARRALQMLDDDTESLEYQNIQLLFAEIAFKKKEYNKALSILDNISPKSDNILKNLMYLEADIYTSKGSPDKAIESFEANFRKLDLITKENQLQRALVLGRAYQNIGSYKDAVEYLDKAIDIARSMQFEDVFISNLYFASARSAYNSGDLDYSEIQVYKAIEAGDKEIEAVCYELIGSIQEDKGEMSKAINNYRYAADKALDCDTKCHILNGLTKIYIDIDNPDEASATSYEALNLLKFVKNKSISMNSIFQHGVALHISGRYLESVKYLLDSARHYEDTSNTSMSSNAYEWLGITQYYLENYNESIKYLDIALKIVEIDSEDPRAIHILSFLADSYYKIRDHNSAISLAKSALSKSIYMDDIGLLASQLMRLAQYYYNIRSNRHFLAIFSLMTDKITSFFDVTEMEDFEELTLLSSKIDRKTIEFVKSNLASTRNSATGIDNDIWQSYGIKQTLNL